MRIQYLSDLHFEFHADAGAAFVASLDPTGVDVLIAAGDIAVGDGIGPALDLLCTRYAKSKVLYLHGNHEFYGTNREHVIAVTRAAVARHANLHWLDNDVVTIAGTRFVGAPLWFRHPGPTGEALKYSMNDFLRIQDFETWVYEENKRTIAFFDGELQKGDVALTHYLPTDACTSKQWIGDPFNVFFVCDVEPIIRANQPRLWVHGHTHDSVDIVVAETRIVCNPFGYVRHELNAAFKDKCVLDV